MKIRFPGKANQPNLDSTLPSIEREPKAARGWFRRLAWPACALGASLSVICGARAEQFFLMNFKGTLTVTTTDKKLVNKPITSADVAAVNLQSIGITDTNPFVLVFHQDQSDLGDTIEVVNKTNGVFAVGVLRLYFQEKLDRADGTLSKRFAYGYNYIDGNSFGTAILNERTTINKNGQTNFVIDGSLQWYWTNSMQVWSGTFSTGQPFVVTNTP